MNLTVSTPCGVIKGCKGKNEHTIAFKGIRYATANRFEYPVQVTHWDGIYDASEYGSCSYQPRAFYNEEDVPEKAFYYHEFRKGETYTYSEDCLFLNIFVPEERNADEKLPVLIYIHGGGYTGGCGHEKHFDEPNWATKGVIGVTLNYRLGPLGFICLPELKEEAGHTGNYGLYDQMTAIKWIKDNIASFGGDPNNISIMGQSAGAMSVTQHCLSPLTEGLFQKAIMSSGGGANKFMSPSKPEKLFDFWHEVMKRCACTTLQELKELPVERLFKEWQKAKKEIKGAGMAASPILDDIFVVEGSKAKQIPYMIGSTSEDIVPFFIYQMAVDWSTSQTIPSYTWFFDRKLPGDNNGAWHSSDLWYWFGTLDNCWRPMEDKDHDLSHQMSEYLCNFVKTGNPNHTGLVQWNPTDASKKVLRLGEKDTAMGKANKLKLIYTMLTNKAVGE